MNAVARRPEHAIVRLVKDTHISVATWIVLAVQTIFFALYYELRAELRDLPAWEKVAFVVTNDTFTVLYFQLLGLRLRRRPAALAAANMLSVFLFLFLSTYRLRMGSALDFSALRSNLGVVAYKSSWVMVMGRVKPISLIGLGVAGALLPIIAFKTRWLKRWPRPRQERGTLIVTSAGLLAILLSPLSIYNETTFFLRSAFQYFWMGLGSADGYPYVKPALPPPSPGEPKGPRPNIFLIMMESFNASFVGARTERGVEYTPFYNELAREGLTAEVFYGNSVQTARGQVATLCSIPPSFRRKVANIEPPISLRALPAILRDNGYQTYFVQAVKDIDFDNAGRFMRHIGFQSALSSADFIGPDDKPYLWDGWGLSDDRLYQKVFTYLDGRCGGEAGPTSGPIDAAPCFVTLATNTNHAMWDHIPDDKKYLYPDARPGEHKKNFANSIYLADFYLRTFFAEMERRPWLYDSIILIMGDHGLADGVHKDNFYNEQYAFEENFRTPFLLLWRGHVAPRTIRGVAYSQLDVAPTLLDLLRIREENHFVGRSMLPETSEQRPIPLIQPYGGTLLGAVIYPMKYVRTYQTGAQALYDVERDPGETSDLLESYEGTGTLAALRRAVHDIEVNQRLIDHDRIWPRR